MTANTTLRFFIGDDYAQVERKVDTSLNENRAWELISASHSVRSDGKHCVACVLKRNVNFSIDDGGGSEVPRGFHDGEK